MAEALLSSRFPKSTAIEQATYEPGRSTLDLWYRGGDRYTYFRVPIELYEGLLQAESAGEFVNRRIKPFFHYEIEPRRRRFRPADDD